MIAVHGVPVGSVDVSTVCVSHDSSSDATFAGWPSACSCPRNPSKFNVLPAQVGFACTRYATMRKLSAPCLPLLAPFKPLRPLLRDSPLLSVAGTKRTLYVSLSCYEHFRTTFHFSTVFGNGSAINGTVS